MSRTITALFDTKVDADAGAERLRQAGVDAAHVQVHDQSTHKTSGSNSTSSDRGLWASVKNVFLPSADRHAYEEGIRRGGFVLTADVDDDATPAAVRALEEAKSVDLDARQEEWRASGWDYQGDADEDALVGSDATDGAYAPYGTRDTDATNGQYRSYSRQPYV